MSSLSARIARLEPGSADLSEVLGPGLHRLAPNVTVTVVDVSVRGAFGERPAHQRGGAVATDPATGLALLDMPLVLPPRAAGGDRARDDDDGDDVDGDDDDQFLRDATYDDDVMDDDGPYDRGFERGAAAMAQGEHRMSFRPFPEVM